MNYSAEGRFSKMIHSVDLAVFAHNEASRIKPFLEDLARQSIFSSEMFSAQLFILANGCTDSTVNVARNLCGAFPNPENIMILDLPVGGKSRTWNTFVHEKSRKDASDLVFLDADIELPEPSTIEKLIRFLVANPQVKASSSRPVKDIDYHPTKLSKVESLIAAGGGTSGHNLRTAICGQLYAMRSSVAREIKLPIGLPVEDGFIRHSIITSVFSSEIDHSFIDQSEEVWHVYASERRIGGLLKHQTRIVIGSAINAAIFGHLIGLRDAGKHQELRDELAHGAVMESWLPQTLRRLLPSRRFGWVPLPWLYSRTLSFLKNGPYTRRRSIAALAGFGMDVVVYMIAQVKMARGTGAGHW